MDRNTDPRLPFRLLCRNYNVDICYTPMLIASSFIKSKKARDIDFTTSKDDHPLVVQFASRDSVEFGLAAQMVEKYSSAVGLNCGCPQKWAIKDGLGASLLSDPQLIYDSIKCVRNLCRDDFPCSIKIRLNDDLRKSVEMAQNIEKCGAGWLDVHGRRIEDGTGVQVNIEGIKLVEKIIFTLD